MSDMLTLFARFIWPTLRHFTNNPTRCVRCLNYVRETGLLCHECQSHTTQQESLPAWPFEINKEDELLILLSGGKDCIYILGQLRKLYPNNKVECMLVDTGFLGPRALKNAQLAASTTNTNLIVESSYKELFHQTLRDAFLQLKQSPGVSSYGVVDYAEGNLVFDIGIKYAQMHSQRIVSGLTTSQLAIIDAPVKQVPGALFPLDAWRPNEDDIILGAKSIVGYKGSFEPLETNSTLIPLMLMMDILRIGYCGFEIEFSRNIRDGLADRTTWKNRFDALKWLTEKGLLNSMMNELLGKLNLTKMEVLP
jgi:hypothetical protein